MFKELFELIPDKGGIRFALTRTGPDTMAVVLVPEFPASKGEAPKLTPLSVSGPVEELETGFVEAVLAYAPEVAKLANNLAQAKASMEEGKKSGKAKAEPKPAPPPQPSMLDLADEDGDVEPTPTGALKRAQAGSPGPKSPALGNPPSGKVGEPHLPLFRGAFCKAQCEFLTEEESCWKYDVALEGTDAGGEEEPFERCPGCLAEFGIAEASAEQDPKQEGEGHGA